MVREITTRKTAGDDGDGFHEAAIGRQLSAVSKTRLSGSAFGLCQGTPSDVPQFVQNDSGFSP